MPLLKQSVIEKIYQTLNTRQFKASDFEIQLPEKGETLVTIIFRHDPNFTFSIFEGRSNSSDTATSIVGLISTKKVPATVEKPGDFTSKQTRIYESYSECIDRISVWCANIHAELRARVPILSEFDELKKQLEDHINFSFQDSESRFSDSEIDELSNKLTELYEKLAELQEKHALTEDQLKELKDELNELKSLAKEYPKGMWGKIAKSRVVTAVTKIATSKESRMLITEGIKKVLGW